MPSPGEGRLTGCYRKLSGDPYILKSLARRESAVCRSPGEGRLTGCYRNLSGDPYILKSLARRESAVISGREVPFIGDALGALRNFAEGFPR